MKKDIDALMEARNLDVILVMGSASHNPYMYYFTGNVHLSGDVYPSAACLIKQRGEEPVLFAGSMEREEAARSGLKTMNLAEYDLKAFMEETGGNASKALALRFKHMFADLGISGGRMEIYGNIDMGYGYDIFTSLKEIMPAFEILGGGLNPTLSEAMTTKDEAEVERIRRMGKATAEIVGRVADFLQSHKAKDGVLVKADGQPLKIGEVKNNINRWAVEANASNPHDCIFSLGRDAGIPHSMGNLDDSLELGKTIIFDIFIQEPGGGYHFDFTRTWCLGFAPEEVQKMYGDVKAVFDDVMGALEANASLADLQNYTCELFEAQGHETLRQNPKIEEGYVHSLGHGLGLNVHEMPGARGDNNALRPGVVVTIEPGLYYPSRGMGARIEDTIYVRPDGSIENIIDYPYDLVLPVEEE